MRVQNISFGKTPILTCQFKQKDTNKKVDATLYKMDPHNPSDIKDVEYSKKARCMIFDMKKDQGRFYPAREYYIIQENKTGEVISCAQTSHHYRLNNAYCPGTSTTIEELADNEKYVNSTEPMLAFLAQNAFERYDKSVVVGTYTDDESQFKRARFSKSKNGDWILPEKRFTNLVDTAVKRNNIEFIG